MQCMYAGMYIYACAVMCVMLYNVPSFKMLFTIVYHNDDTTTADRAIAIEQLKPFNSA